MQVVFWIIEGFVDHHQYGIKLQVRFDKQSNPDAAHIPSGARGFGGKRTGFIHVRRELGDHFPCNSCM